ncbi:PIG-L deacetylase family protein [Paracoccus sp. (in: a-proteobacteria)]|uniref:PIG-L deacetylase family protein n=1 Tax=Paracoccus sp. TaxID=267 RepID=UPI0035B42A9F
MSGFLDALARAPLVGVADLLDDRPLVVIAPHPDDETLGCGALLFDAHARGNPCHVICVTNGNRSHPGSRAWPPARLAATRRAEFEGAVAILAPGAATHWLDHPDCEAPVDAASARHLLRMIPERAVVLASWGHDPHIDHESTARLARLALVDRHDATLHFYPIWGRFTDRPAPARLIQASDAARAAKARALACHRTQMTQLIDDDPDGFVMEDWRQQHFLSHPEVILAP